MQDLPSRDALLSGVSRFLVEQVASALDDRGLAFRLKIAVHLIETVRRELANEVVHDARELAGLRALLGGDDGSAEDGHQAEIQRLNAALADLIRDSDDLELEATKTHLMASLRDRLSVVQPRFDLGYDCEKQSEGTD